MVVGLEGDEAKVRARAASYLYGPGLSDSLIAANGWSCDELERLRALPVSAELRAGPTTGRAAECLATLGREVPDEWIAEGGATGSAEQCAGRLVEALQAGSDQIILHGAGASASRLAPLLDRFEERFVAQGLSSTMSTPSARIR
jgi:hypothetical protein